MQAVISAELALNCLHAFLVFTIIRSRDNETKIPRNLRRGVHDGTGDSGLAMHRPGFRVTDAPLSDELQRACDAYEHDLTTAWRRAAGKDVVPDTAKASGNDAMPVDDIETAYRLYAEEISQVWKRPG